MNKTQFFSRAQAARMLGVSPAVIERVALLNGVKVWQVPGHSRKWFRRADVERLLAAADMGTEARA